MATLTELKDAVKNEFSSRLLGGNPVLAESNFDDIAAFVGFLQFGNEASLDTIRNTLTPATATGTHLDAWGDAFGVARLGATAASGLVQLTGTAGATVPAGTLLTRCDGITYTTDAAVTFTGTTATVNVTATTTGDTTVFLSGGALTIGSAAVGVASTAISLGIIGGADIEQDSTYRDRIRTAIRTPCRVGTVEDYQFWASQYPGVTRVCVQPQANGPGTVKVFALMDNTYPDGIPTAADIAAIATLVPFPIGVVGEVCAPSVTSVDVSISGFGTVTAAEFANIRTVLENAFLDFFDCAGSTVCLADLYRALAENFTGCYSITSPTANVTVPSGSVPVLGTLTVV